MKFVLRVNWLILLILALAVVLQMPVDSSSTHIIWTDFVIFFGLLFVQVICLFRLSVLHGFCLVMLYTLALLTGLRMMLSIDLLFSLTGALAFLLELLLIVYLIGVRGYLKSANGMKVMGISPKVPDASVS